MEFSGDYTRPVRSMSSPWRTVRFSCSASTATPSNANSLPILVICELLGVPYADRTEFRAWTDAAADVVDGSRSAQGLGDLFGYGLQLVARKRREPG